MKPSWNKHKRGSQQEAPATVDTHLTMALSPLLSEALGESQLLLGALGDALAGGPAQEPAANLYKPGVDVVVLLIFASALFIFNWGTRIAVFDPLAHSLTTGSAAGAASRREKFGQSASEALFYGGSFVLGLCVVPRQPWIWPSAQWWIGKDGTPDGPYAKISDELKCYILLYIARYVQGLVSVFLEHKRKDFVEMLIHHTTTVALIALAYTHQYNRVGVVVMILLDPADVPLHFAKMCKYMGKDGAADNLFIVFGVTFFVTRLVLYPYAVWSGHIEAQRYLPPFGGPEWICVGLLYVLLVLQVYWMYLIAKVAVKLALHGEAEDVRSDEEEEGEGEGEGTGKGKDD